jgi:Protein of unknown function (DUF1800)
MARDPKAEAALALHRFGFGPRLGSIAAIASDPRGALIAELDRPGAGRISDPDLLTSGEAARGAFNFRQERKARRLAERAQREAVKNAPPPTPERQAAMAAPPAEPRMEAKAGEAAPLKPNALPGFPQQVYLEEAKARIDAALGADLGFAERLVWFWSNHFCVSADKGPVRALCGAYEREAIRAHVLGRFADMLVAVESHPAMLIYLDNARSIGPDSIAGRNQHRGLNENLAREILELHTLGVRTVYSQADVTSFAKVITGWSIVPPRQDPERGGEFTFNPRMHEPGAQAVIGRTYPDGGIEQGRAVLADLARHPATARHAAGRRRAAARPGRPLGQALPRHRRQPQGTGAHARLGAGGVGGAAQQAQGAGHLVRRRAARNRHHPAGHPPGDPGAEHAGRAAVAAARAQRFLRRQRRLDGRHFRTRGCRQSARRPRCRAGRSGGGDRHRARAARLRRDAPDDHARGEPAAGAGVVADGARIPEELTRRGAKNRCHPGQAARSAARAGIDANGVVNSWQ